MASATARPRRRPRQPRGRDFTVVARAERDGRILCSAALVVVKSSPGLLGIEPTDAITAWFYGEVRPAFELELEEIAHATRKGEAMPDYEPIDLVLLADGGDLRLEGCILGMPTRYAGPATTLEYRVAHPGRAGAAAAPNPYAAAAQAQAQTFVTLDGRDSTSRAPTAMEGAVVTSSRPYTTAARAERDGRMVCSAVLLSVKGAPGRLGSEAVEDMTAWFYGDLNPRFEVELELLADAARGATDAPELEPVDLVLQTPSGEMRLEGCRLDLPVRYAGPASTLEYRISHAPAGVRHLRLVA